MVKILWASDSATWSSGYGSVTREILTRLGTAKLECYQLGFQWNPGTQQPMPCLITETVVQNGQRVRMWRTLPFTMLAGSGNRMMDPFAWNTYPHYLNTIQPDYLITFGDLWHFDHLLSPNYNFKSAQNPKHPAWYAYFEIDGAPLKHSFKPILDKPNLVISASKFGEEAIKKLTDNKVTTIWHGVDTNIFKPMDKIAAKKFIMDVCLKDPRNTEEFRKKFVEKVPFIFGYVGRNTERKRIDRLMRAYELFLERNPEAKNDTFLMMNTDPNDVNMSEQDVDDFRTKFNIRDNTSYFALSPNYNFQSTTEELVVLYNAMDTFVSSNSGEGFGVVFAEASACGIPSITTDYTSAEELIGNRGWRVPVSDWYWYSRQNIRRALVDINKFADAMTEAYQKDAYRKNLGNQAYRFAKENLDWNDCIMKKWFEILNGEKNG